MTSKFPRYDEYKDSGEEWLGRIPSSWEAIQIGHLSPVKRGASPRPIDDAKYFDDEGEYAWTRIADVTASDVYLTDSPQRLSELGSSLSVKLEPGELFLSIAATVGKPCITGIKACIHDGFVYFPQLGIPNKFLFYVFAAGQAYKGLGKMGTQLNLNTETVARIKVGIGSAEELSGIVDFLDYETAKIDALIWKQQQLIALLNEKRQAVISHAVTKGLPAAEARQAGLNPDAPACAADRPMRDSGVEWLGEVPAHWEVVHLKRFISTRKGAPFKSTDFTDEGVQVVRASDIKNLGIKNPSVFLPASFVDSHSRAVLRAGELILSTVGSGPQVRNSAVGQIGRVPEELDGTLLNQNTVVFRVVDDRLSEGFLFHLVQVDGYRDHLDLHAHGTANQASLNVVDMLNFAVPVPPQSEQHEIVDFVTRTGLRLDALENAAAAQVELLRERRTALVSAAVTGKIDVRNWSVPDE